VCGTGCQLPEPARCYRICRAADPTAEVIADPPSECLASMGDGTVGVSFENHLGCRLLTSGTGIGESPMNSRGVVLAVPALTLGSKSDGRWQVATEQAFMRPFLGGNSAVVLFQCDDYRLGLCSRISLTPGLPMPHALLRSRSKSAHTRSVHLDAINRIKNLMHRHLPGSMPARPALPARVRPLAQRRGCRTSDGMAGAQAPCPCLGDVA
jgi:hypothetical protein